MWKLDIESSDKVMANQEDFNGVALLANVRITKDIISDLFIKRFKYVCYISAIEGHYDHHIFPQSVHY